MDIVRISPATFSRVHKNLNFGISKLQSTPWGREEWGSRAGHWCLRRSMASGMGFAGHFVKQFKKIINIPCGFLTL